MLYILCILMMVAILILTGVIIEKTVLKKSYPEYYKDVIITFKIPGDSQIYEEKAWLARADDLRYIWTLTKNEHIIEDSWVKSWRYGN